MTSKPTITVYGAYGHTGRFVVAELGKRGWVPILSGRDAVKLKALGNDFPGLELRPAAVEDPESLARALGGAAAVINCAGPFYYTATPVIEAALSAGIPYLDVAAELEANRDTFEQYGSRAADLGSVILPAMAFYGGLGDLLATVAMGNWPDADEISIAYALSSWKPTIGTRASGQVSRQRREGRRAVLRNNRLEYRSDAAPISEWDFPAPWGRQTMVGEFTMADSITIPRHLKAATINSYMTAAPLSDLSDPDLSPPPAIDESGRSAQTFLVEVRVRRSGATRLAWASGRDIYAITAPLVVEAAIRIVDGRTMKTGVLTAGEMFDAREFLQSLSPEHFSLGFSETTAD